jgi:hypothetical protein
VLRAGRDDRVENLGRRLVGVEDLDVAGNYAYIGESFEAGAVQVVDASNPAEASLRGRGPVVHDQVVDAAEVPRVASRDRCTEVRRDGGDDDIHVIDTRPCCSRTAFMRPHSTGAGSVQSAQRTASRTI